MHDGAVESGGFVVLVDGWDVDPVDAGGVVGPVASVDDIGADVRKPLPCWGVWLGWFVVLEAVYLVGVEDGVDPWDQTGPVGGVLAVGLGLVVVCLLGDPFDDLGGSFALADLGADVLPLAIGGPFTGGESSFDPGKGKGDGVGQWWRRAFRARKWSPMPAACQGMTHSPASFLVIMSTSRAVTGRAWSS